MTIKPRKGQAPPELSRDEFGRRFQRDFLDPAFDAARDSLAQIEAIAWDGYIKGRKSPVTKKAGPEFKFPDFELPAEWLDTHTQLQAAQIKQADPTAAFRVLLICGAARNDGTCPGEMSKTFRLTQLARETLEASGIEVDVLDLSLQSSEYRKQIHPCKGCVSTAMPLCHWPCSCYPNHSLGQTNDWMAEIYTRWTAAHGVIILTPVYWYQTPSVLKLMIDRLVCADGGNPDLTSSKGKDPVKAKELELAGWPYPKHLAGRVYGVVVHGDVAGIEGVRRGLTDWLDWMGLIDAGAAAKLDRFIGYYEPYATSHKSLDRDTAVQEEVRNVARSVLHALEAQRAGRLEQSDEHLLRPRPK
jgi:multimeric flavodoxin WrbA